MALQKSVYAHRCPLGLLQARPPFTTEIPFQIYSPSSKLGRSWNKVSRVTFPPYARLSPSMCLHLILVLGLLTFWKTSGSDHLIQMQPQTRRHLRCGGGWILNSASTFSPILALHNASISVCAIKH